jgi:hypothetical protein
MSGLIALLLLCAPLVLGVPFIQSQLVSDPACAARGISVCRYFSVAPTDNVGNAQVMHAWWWCFGALPLLNSADPAQIASFNVTTQFVGSVDGYITTNPPQRTDGPYPGLPAGTPGCSACTSPASVT